ncbi:uncharacterized protein LOC121892233 isoform X4 [Thunnus maccoyii]|uniref:uncharacterized protein LOC121892233 isoform X4 n=1 Tax=Thunnus maccoyii TaxID=8240 RepID=UPI001C4C03C7|nr:uncharacterized protein LOC121892233 isoform X4 [Thunnus maccoyii]
MSRMAKMKRATRIALDTGEMRDCISAEGILRLHALPVSDLISLMPWMTVIPTTKLLLTDQSVGVDFICLTFFVVTETLKRHLNLLIPLQIPYLPVLLQEVSPHIFQLETLKRHLNLLIPLQIPYLPVLLQEVSPHIFQLMTLDSVWTMLCIQL